MRALAVLLLAFVLLALPCGAAEPETEAELDPQQAARNLPRDAAEALEGLAVPEADLDGGLERIWALIRDHFRDALSEVLRPAAAVAAAALLCSLAEPLSLREAGRFDYISLGGCLAVSAAAVADVQGVVRLGSTVVRELADYSRILLPALTTAAVSAGAVTSAGAKYAAAALFSDLLLTAAEKLVLPMICAYVAVTVAGAALGTGQLDGAARLLRWCAMSLLKALAAAFTGYLALTGVLSGGADAAAVKAAKAALSTALPVVGRALSDASEAIVAGAGLARNAIGLYGVLAVLAAAALPVLRLGLRYLLYKGAAALAGAVAGGRLGSLANAIGSACGMVLGLVGAAAVMEFLAVVSLMGAAAG